jgi:hypothetical protein
LFRATTVPGILPSEFSPRRDRAPLSRPPTPMQLSTHAQERTAQALVAIGFPDAHALTQLPGSPADYRVPFRKQSARFPVPLDLEQRSRSLPQASPTSKPYSPCESVRTSPSCPGLAAGTLLGFCPSGAFSFRASDPRPARARKLEHAPSPEDSGSRPRGPLDPPSQVRRLEHRNAQTSRR